MDNVGRALPRDESGSLGKFVGGEHNIENSYVLCERMKKIIDRFLRWRPKPSAPPKRIVPAHEIALKHAEARRRANDSSGQTPTDEENQVTPAAEKVLVADKVRQKKRRQGKRGGREPVEHPIADASRSDEKMERARQREARRQEAIAEIRRNRAIKKRRRQSFI